jgi:hypothetical protein
VGGEGAAAGALLVLLAVVFGGAGCDAGVDFARPLSLLATKATTPPSATIAINTAAHKPRLLARGLLVWRAIFFRFDFLFLDMKIF